MDDPFISCRFGFCLILLLWETFLTWAIKRGMYFFLFPWRIVGYSQNYQLEFIDTRKRYLLRFKLLISLLPCKQKFKSKRRKESSLSMIYVPSCLLFSYLLSHFISSIPRTFPGVNYLTRVGFCIS